MRRRDGARAKTNWVLWPLMQGQTVLAAVGGLCPSLGAAQTYSSPRLSSGSDSFRSSFPPIRSRRQNKKDRNP